MKDLLKMSMVHSSSDSERPVVTPVFTEDISDSLESNLHENIRQRTKDRVSVVAVMTTSSPEPPALNHQP